MKNTSLLISFIAITLLFLSCDIHYRHKTKQINKSEFQIIFTELDESIGNTSQNFSIKTKALYQSINSIAVEDIEKYGQIQQKSETVKINSDQVFNDIDRLIIMIKQEAEGPDATRCSEIQHKDNSTAAEEIMVNDGGPMMGDSLRNWLIDYRSTLLNILQDTSLQVYKNISRNLKVVDSNYSDTKTGENYTWQESLCKGMPLVGTIALLSKLQADIRYSEADILEYLLAQIE